MTSLSTKLVTTLEEFEALKEPWNKLVGDMECPEIFYFWEWNFHYFRHYRGGARLFIVVVRHSSGEIAGIAPLCVHDVRRFGGRARVVDMIVTDLGDYQNILVHAAYHRGHVVSAVLGCLREQSRQWDVIDISQLCSRDSSTFHIVNLAQAYSAWSVRVQNLTAVAVRNLKTARIIENKRQLRQIRNRLRTLEERGFSLRIGCKD